MVPLFYNYESSKYKTVFLIRSFRNEDWKVLLYILERLKLKHSKFVSIPYTLPTDTGNIKLKFINIIPLNLLRAITFNYKIEMSNQKNYEYINNSLSIIGLVKRIKQEDFVTSDPKITNLTTQQAKRLLIFTQSIFPDWLMSDRSSSTKSIEIYEQFSLYTKFMNYEHIEVSSTIGRPIILPKAEIIYEKPLNVESKYIIQPKYIGIHCILINNHGKTVLYNRYAELFKKINSDLIPRDIVIECIILPTIDNELFSWRVNSTTYKIIVLDIIKIKNEVFYNLQYNERISKFKEIECPLFIKPTPISWDDMQTQLYTSIGGIVLRDRTQLIFNKKLLCFNFPATQYYRFDKDYCGNLLNTKTVFEIYDNELLVATLPVISKETQDSCIKFNLTIKEKLFNYKTLMTKNGYDTNDIQTHIEMSNYKTVLMVYGSDEHSLYYCKFDCKHLQFKHVGTIPNYNSELKFEKVNIFVIGNKVLVKGVALLRVYFNIDKSIIGYETKITTSKYDVPIYSPLYCEDCTYLNICYNCKNI